MKKKTTIHVVIHKCVGARRRRRVASTYQSEGLYRAQFVPWADNNMMIKGADEEQLEN